MRYLHLLVLSGAVVSFASSVAAQRNRGSGQEVWRFLAQKYDQNRDGRIEPGEYGREKEKFAGYDRDRDGVLTAADFRGGLQRRRAGGQRRRVDVPAELGRVIAQGADLDADGKVSRDEWGKVAPKVDSDGDKLISAQELKDLLCAAMARSGLSLRAVERRGKRLLDRDRSGKVELAELLALFARVDADQDGSISAKEARRQNLRAPLVGEVAPDFTLPRVDDPKQQIRLSSFVGKKPVALIFGSYT